MTSKPRKPPTPLLMWAAIDKNESGRSEQIYGACVRFSRREARAAYLALWDEEYHARALDRVRFARVIVSIEGAAQ